MRPLPLPARIGITWCGILPLVLVVQLLLSFVTSGWPQALATALTITIVVPVAVTWVVPGLMRAYVRLFMRRETPARADAHEGAAQEAHPRLAGHDGPRRDSN